MLLGLRRVQRRTARATDRAPNAADLSMTIAGAGAARGFASDAAPMTQRRLGIRWTIGNVSMAGFDALRLSIVGAARCFGASAEYAVCAAAADDGIALGAHEFDFLRGGEPYKYAWGAHDRPLFRRVLTRGY